jgi:hypothetical protein
VGGKKVKVNINKTYISEIMDKLEEANKAIEKYQTENPTADIEAILSANKKYMPIMRILQNSELDKFATYAKEQGTKMTFGEMEEGVVAAGRKDMQSTLAELANGLKFEKPICEECGEAMENNAIGKKK